MAPAPRPDVAPRLDRRWLLAMSGVVLRRPGLWLVALRQAVVMAPAGWWRRAPFLPVPDAGYLRFRMQTMYGDPDRAPDPADLVSYLTWCRAWPAIAKHHD